MIKREGNRLYLGNRCLGQIKDDYFFIIKEREHFFRKYNGFGFNKELIEFLDSMNIEKVKVVYRHKGETLYTVPTNNIIQADIYNNKGEEQFVLSLEDLE